jgi:hypothetical protein
MLMNKIMYAAIAAVLAGCATAEKRAEPMTIVIPPGHEISIDGKPVGVYGRSTCPKWNASMFFLYAPSPLKTSGCLVVTPTSKEVQARVAIDGKLLDETWAVEREKNRFVLRRPGGLPVTSYMFSKDWI